MFYEGLPAVLPSDYPTELMDFNEDDFKSIALNQSKTKLYKISDIKATSLDGIIAEVYKKYPSFDTFDPQQYKKLFPKLSTDEIIKNSESILDYTEKLMAYEVSSAFSQLKGAKYALTPRTNKNARGYISAGTWLNEVCTVAVVIAHLRLDMNGLWDSVQYANLYSSTYGLPTTGGGSNDRMDALRHGIWGIYIGKFGTWRYDDPNKAERIIGQLLNAHECGQGGGIESAMDRHNNTIALKYYADNVVVAGPWYNRSTEIYGHPGYIASVLANYSVDLVTSEAEIDARNNVTLVRTK